MKVTLPPEIELLDKQEDIYQGKLGELQPLTKILLFSAIDL